MWCFPLFDLSGVWDIRLVDFTIYKSISHLEEEWKTRFKLVNRWYRFPPDPTRLKIFITKKLTIEFNNSTPNVEFLGSDETDFTKPSSITPLLGFSLRNLKANMWHQSDHTVDIIKLNVIRVECNIVRWSFENGVESYIIHEFYPAVPLGFKILESPKNVMYLPVNTKHHNNTSCPRKQ